MNEQAPMMSQQQQQQLMNMNQSLMSMNQMNPHPPQPQMVQMNRSYGMWPQQFQNPNLNPVATKQPSSAFNKSLGPRNNWKGKRVNKPNDKRRSEQQKTLISSGGVGGVNMVGGGSSGGNTKFNNYNPPTLNELQHQNRLKTRKYFPKKKFNKNNSINMNMGGNNGRFAPFAPRNTTSFLIRAKRSGGIAPLVSPYPVTPAVLPTPILSPSTEVLGDMAKEEWGVDGYGSMKGLIRLRSPGHEMEIQEDEEEDEGGSSESDVEEHVEVERRLDHDLSRFEMIYDPNSGNVGGMEHHILENRVDDQDTHIAHLEEENLILKERLFLMERELGDLRRRLVCLERSRNQVEDINDDESENESESRGEEPHSMEDNNEDSGGENNEADRCVKEGGSCPHIADGSEAAETTDKVVQLHVEGILENDDEEKEKNIASEIVTIPVGENQVESINCDDESTEGKKAEQRMGELSENNNGRNNHEVDTTGNIDAESNEHMVQDVCLLEGEVAKENMVSEEDLAN